MSFLLEWVVSLHMAHHFGFIFFEIVWTISCGVTSRYWQISQNKVTCIWKGTCLKVLTNLEFSLVWSLFMQFMHLNSFHQSESIFYSLLNLLKVFFQPLVHQWGCLWVIIVGLNTLSFLKASSHELILCICSGPWILCKSQVTYHWTKRDSSIWYGDPT